jgi:hypothetical protein
MSQGEITSRATVGLLNMHKQSPKKNMQAVNISMPTSTANGGSTTIAYSLTRNLYEANETM